MSDLLAMLTDLGFGEYEARAYVALLQHNPINGYELARQSGVPRGSIYGALARLEERGAAVRLEAAEGTRYAPAAPDQLLQGMAARFQHTLGNVERQLAALAAPAGSEHVWNASGYAALLEHARMLVDGAERALLLALWPQESLALAERTQDALARGVQIRTLCLAACAQECGKCRGHIYRYDVLPARDRRGLLIVRDETELLAGEITATGSRAPAEDAQAIRTRQPLLVDLAAGYIRHSIMLALVLADLGPQLAEALGPETRARLEALDPDGLAGGWLERLQRLLAAGTWDRSQTEIG
jgi:predicted transcriptional regulator